MMGVFTMIRVGLALVLAAALSLGADAAAGRARGVQKWIDAHREVLRDASRATGVPSSVLAAICLWEGGWKLKQTNWCGQTVPARPAPAPCPPGSWRSGSAIRPGPCMRMFDSFPSAVFALGKNLCTHPGYAAGRRVMSAAGGDIKAFDHARFFRVIGAVYSIPGWERGTLSVLRDHRLKELDTDEELVSCVGT